TGKHRRAPAEREPLHGRADPSRSASQVPLFLGIGLVGALLIAFIGTRGTSTPEVAQATPSESVAAGTPTPTPTPSPVDRRSPAERSFDKAEAYLEQNPGDLIGALPLYQNVVGRGGPWAEKAQAKVRSIQSQLADKANSLLQQAESRAQRGRISAAIELLDQAGLRYDEVPGIKDRVERQRLMVEQQAVDLARGLVEKARAKAKEGGRQAALALLNDYEETGVESADKLVVTELEELAGLALPKDPEEARRELVALLRAVPPLLQRRSYEEASRK
ncbi:MAG TPA: hypothetical protein DEA08_26930, partial [Planctomycetes bacterium]|nr:hypothetical protein [Planctomycetota bacterium]